MSVELNEKGQQLFELLITVPPSLKEAEEFLNSNDLTADDVTKVGINYADECYCDVCDWATERNVPHPEEFVPGLHSSYIVEVTKLLLRFGLKPNAVYGEEKDNFMFLLQFIHNEYLAADTFALLFEYGGDPNAEMDGETIFEEVDFDVFFGAVEQENRQLYSSVVHCWLVMLAYGGKYQNKNVVTVFKEYDSQTVFDLKKLKNHRDYSFGLSHEADGVTIHIYDKKTLWEVVRG